MMKTAEWRKVARPYLIPALPGRWTLNANNAFRLPTRHLAWIISFQLSAGGFRIHALVLPMFVHSDVIDATVGARALGDPQPQGRYFRHEDGARILADPETEMAAIRQLVLDEGIPHLHHVGDDLPAYLGQLAEFASSRPHGLGTGHTETVAAAAHLLLGDLTSARAAYQRVLEGALLYPHPHPNWLQALVRTAEERLDLDDASLHSVRDDLIEVEDRMRAQWKLPEPEEPDPRP